MRKFLLSLCLIAALAFVGCSDKYDDSDIVAGLENAEDRLDALEDWQMTVEEELASIQTIIEALEANDYVTNVTEITSGGEVVGYQITFAQYGVVTITNGNDGADGNDGEDGTAGSNGTNGTDGDSMFDIVDVDSENGQIYIKLVGDDTEYYIPMTTEMFIFDTATNSEVGDVYYYSLDSQNLEFQIKDLPDECVGVNAALLTVNGTVESTATTRTDETDWSVLTTYDSETKIATVKVTVGSAAFTDEEKALLKITAISSTGTESVAILTLAPITDAESMSEWDEILEAISTATTASAYNYTGEIEDGYTVELPATKAGEVTINITQGLDGNGINFVDEDDDDPFEGVLYLVLPSTNESGTIAVNLTSAATVYIIDGSLQSVINGGTYTKTSYSMAMPTRADDLDEVDAVDGADNATIYIKSKVETVEMYSGDITIDDGGSVGSLTIMNSDTEFATDGGFIENLILMDADEYTIAADVNVTSITVPESGTVTILGTVESVTTNGAAITISDTGTVTDAITIDSTASGEVTIEIAGTVKEVTNESTSSAVTVTTTDDGVLETAPATDSNITNGSDTLAVSASTLEGFIAANANNQVTSIVLTGSITLTESIVLNSPVTINSDLTIDGGDNKYTMTLSSSTLAQFECNANLTLNNVTISHANDGYALYVPSDSAATEINITNSTLSGYAAIYTMGNNATYNINGSTLTGTNSGSSDFATVCVEDGATGNTFNIEGTRINTVQKVGCKYEYAIDIRENTGSTTVNLSDGTSFDYTSNGTSTEGRYYFIEHKVNNGERSTFTRDDSITFSGDVTGKGMSLGSGLLFGDGTKDTPYQIYDNYDLNMVKYYTDYYNDIYALFMQMDDIEYSLVTYSSVYPSPMTTINSSTSSTTTVTDTRMIAQNFYGKYQGEGHYIDNWGYNETVTGANWGTIDQNIGLFAYVHGHDSTIQDLTLKSTDGLGIIVTESCDVTDLMGVGAFAGNSGGTIKNCTNYIPITVYSTNNLCRVGGMYGKPMYQTYTDLKDGGNYINIVTTKHCTNNANITVTGSGSAGGIIGGTTDYSSYVDITTSTMNGNVTAPYAYGVYVTPELCNIYENTWKWTYTVFNEAENVCNGTVTSTAN